MGHFALSLNSPMLLPDIVAADDKASLLLMGIAVGLVVGIMDNSAGRVSPSSS